jgi:hypothetical protein
MSYIVVPIPAEIARIPGKAHGVWRYDNGVLVSRSFEPAGGEERWHMAVSHPARYPAWDEIKAAAREFLPADGFYVLCFPPERLWLNLHPHCFHLWETRDRWLIEQMIVDGGERLEGGLIITR